MLASVGHRHCWSSFLTLRPMSAANVGVCVGPAGPTLAANVGLSVGKLDQQCRRPTLANIQANTQSITVVKYALDTIFSIINVLNLRVNRGGLTI